MSSARCTVSRRRAQREWSQAELARRAGIPRTTISAIEGERLTPSVSTALALARALECSVEELFSTHLDTPGETSVQWAWTPRTTPSRYWGSEVGGRRLLYPAEGLSLNHISHDGVWRGSGHEIAAAVGETTLVLVCCDPAAGLLASEYAKMSGFRLLVVSRGSAEALGLLQRGLAHVAGLHRSTAADPERNVETVREKLGAGFQLVRVVQWQEGLALAPGNRATSVRAGARGARRWALRETGSAARECLDEVCARAAGRTVYSHTAVAEAVSGGWADAGICVQLSAEEAGLRFLPVRAERLDFCFARTMQHDPRVQALIRLLRSRSYRALMSDLPGYDTRMTGEMVAVSAS